MKNKIIFGVIAASTMSFAVQAEPVTSAVAGASMDARNTAATTSPVSVVEIETSKPSFVPRYPSQSELDKPVVPQKVITQNGAMIVVDNIVVSQPVKTKVRSNVAPMVDGKTVSIAKPPIATQSPTPSVLNLPLTDGGGRVAPVRSQEMPGIGVMPGSPSDYQIKSVRVGADRNERVFISLTQLNKIATPFASPEAIDGTGATLKAIGQDIFIKSANADPLTIYISDGGAGQSIGITLVPQPNLPAQSIVLVPDRPVVAGANPSQSAPEMVAPDYTGRLIGLTKKLALGSMPQGYTKSRLPSSTASDGKTIFQPQHKYAGSVYDVYSYDVKSIREEPVELSEESFYSESVRAVAFYPKTMLQNNESTTVFIVVDRDIAGANK